MKYEEAYVCPNCEHICRSEYEGIIHCSKCGHTFSWNHCETVIVEEKGHKNSKEEKSKED